MTTKKNELDEKMERLALDVANRLLGNGAVDDDFISGFKALTTYYTATRKLSKVPAIEDGPTGGGFGAAKRRIAAASEPPSGNSIGAPGGTDGIIHN